MQQQIGTLRVYRDDDGFYHWTFAQPGMAGAAPGGTFNSDQLPLFAETFRLDVTRLTVAGAEILEQVEVDQRALSEWSGVRRPL